MDDIEEFFERADNQIFIEYLKTLTSEQREQLLREYKKREAKEKFREALGGCLLLVILVLLLSFLGLFSMAHKREQQPKDATRSQQKASDKGLERKKVPETISHQYTQPTLHSPIIPKPQSIKPQSTKPQLIPSASKPQFERQLDENRPPPKDQPGRVQEKKNADNKAAKWRTWTDATGQYQIEAEYGGMIGDAVFIKKKDGTKKRVAIEKLSEADQAWLKKRTGKRGEY